MTDQEAQIFETVRRAAKKAHFDDLRPESSIGKQTDFNAGFKAAWDYVSRSAQAHEEAAVVATREACATFTESQTSIWLSHRMQLAVDLRSLPAPTKALEEFERKARLDEAMQSGHDGYCEGGYSAPDCDCRKRHLSTLASAEKGGF